jgi:hypothetical protein
VSGDAVIWRGRERRLGRKRRGGTCAGREDWFDIVLVAIVNSSILFLLVSGEKPGVQNGLADEREAGAGARATQSHPGIWTEVSPAREGLVVDMW